MGWFWGRDSESLKWRLERDTERGYSINVKQVVLAFAVEFVIIGLILANQVAAFAKLPNATWWSIIEGTSLFVALAMAELARVPLAIAVRTQSSWNIKLVAVAGVMAAVVVTSVNLSLIGRNSYDARLEEGNQKRVELLQLRDQKTDLATQIVTADNAVQQKRSDRDSLYEQQSRIQLDLNKQQNITPGQIRTTDQYGTTSVKTTFGVNPAIAVQKKELDALKPKIAAAEAALKQAEAQRATYDARQLELDQKISAAATVYREAINRSLLHSFASMLFGKDPDKLTDGEVKTGERYVIWIPAIAAALSSTLIAMTAVRRRKRPKLAPEPTLPDDAVTYLFGPVVTALREAANDAVAAAMSGHTKPADAAAAATNGHTKPADAAAATTNGHTKPADAAAAAMNGHTKPASETAKTPPS
jgi:hypothetical protein